MTRHHFTLEYVKEMDVLRLGAVFREIDPQTGHVPLFPDWVLVEVVDVEDLTDRNGPKKFKVCKFAKCVPSLGYARDKSDVLQSTLEIPVGSLVSAKSRFRAVYKDGLQVQIPGDMPL